MDSKKTAYFVAKYRAASTEELQEVRSQLGSLADEAEAAFKQVAGERGIGIPTYEQRLAATSARELTPEERATQTRLSSALWGGWVARTIKLQFPLLFALPGLLLLGPQGLGMHPLVLVVVLAALFYMGARMGKSFTRSVCADGDKTVEQKRRTLHIYFWLFWPTLVAVSIIAIGVARAISRAP